MSPGATCTRPESAANSPRGRMRVHCLRYDSAAAIPVPGAHAVATYRRIADSLSFPNRRFPMSKVVRVAVTGAAGRVSSSLIVRLASGEVFGPETKVVLQLLELPPSIAPTAMKNLEGA